MTERVTIGAGVWQLWRERSAEEDEWFLDLLIAPAARGRSIGTDVREALGLVHEGTCLVDAGEWSVMDVDDGVVVHVTESAAFEAMLRAFADELGRRGIEASVSLWDPVEPPLLPLEADHLCSLWRVRGGRVRRDVGRYRWEADEQAYLEALTVAERWSRGAAGLRWVTLGTAGTVCVAAGEDAVRRMRPAIDDGYQVSVVAIDGDGFRGIATGGGLFGAITLTIGGAAVQGDRWAAALAELRALLVEVADHLVYGYVARGWSAIRALSGALLTRDR